MSSIFLEEKNQSYISKGNSNIGPGSYAPSIINPPSTKNKKYPGFMSSGGRENESSNYFPG